MAKLVSSKKNNDDTRMLFTLLNTVKGVVEGQKLEVSNFLERYGEKGYTVAAGPKLSIAVNEKNELQIFSRRHAHKGPIISVSYISTTAEIIPNNREDHLKISGYTVFSVKENNPREDESIIHHYLWNNETLYYYGGPFKKEADSFKRITDNLIRGSVIPKGFNYIYEASI